MSRRSASLVQVGSTENAGCPCPRGRRTGGEGIPYVELLGLVLEVDDRPSKVCLVNAPAAAQGTFRAIQLRSQ